MKSLWTRARTLAEATPASRNRTVDFLRAISIAVVILGHWLVSAPYLDAGRLVPGHMLALAPWTQWLTLFVQVMPIFFFVGGYANAVAWEAARRKGTPKSAWLASRLERLFAPVLPVLLLWVGLGLAVVAIGADPKLVHETTQAALVPIWFLAVYIAIGMTVPACAWAWRRFEMGSVAFLVAAAIVVDGAGFGLNVPGLRYANYAFVWLAVHQLGFAWHAGRIRRPLLWAAGGALATACLIRFGPYPLAMVGGPGEIVSNSSPPSLALLALGVTQMGIVLRLENRIARWLTNVNAWTATILVNGMIMTVYLWHMTAMIVVFAAVMLLGGIGLDVVPDSALWWASRPVWLAIFATALLASVPFLARFERPRPRAAEPSAPRLLMGAGLLSWGLWLVSQGGVVAASGTLRVVPGLLPIIGSWLAGVGPLARRATARAARGRSSL